MHGAKMAKRAGNLTSWLESAPRPAFTLYAGVVAFLTYFCMYAFRKPFAAAEFESLTFFGTPIELKTALVIGQIVGYALSKYIGIKVCSEMTRRYRARALVLLILAAEAALVLFAVLPGELKVLAIFLNGVPLGMVWGLVVWYLEGRRTSEMLLAILSCSFIVSSGMVKDVGRFLLQHRGVSEAWMPAHTGLLFLPLFLLSVWLLDRLPPPDAGDEAARVARRPMTGSQRLALLGNYFLGLALLFVVYLFLTAYRDFRDNYGVEIFKAVGYGQEPAIFTRTEWPVAFGVLVLLALLNTIKDNHRGVMGAFAIMIAGTLLMGLSTLLWEARAISGVWWMILIGLGAYMAYVPFGSVLFDRLIASTGTIGTAVFAIYVADAIGYTGSVGVQLYKDLVNPELSRFGFFCGLTYFMSAIGTVGLVASCLYFRVRHRTEANPHAGDDGRSAA